MIHKPFYQAPISHSDQRIMSVYQLVKLWKYEINVKHTTKTNR